MSLPYYAVIFSSRRTASDTLGYQKMAERMIDLAKGQTGFLRVENCRGSDGFGITVSYWKSLDDIAIWKANSEHRIAQEFGRLKWYTSFTTRVCKVEREYSFGTEEINEL